MRLTRQIDEAAGFWSEAIGGGIFEILCFLFRKPYRAVLLWLLFMAWWLQGWADMKAVHLRDEFYFAYVESYQRAVHHQQLGR